MLSEAETIQMVLGCSPDYAQALLSVYSSAQAAIEATLLVSEQKARQPPAVPPPVMPVSRPPMRPVTNPFMPSPSPPPVPPPHRSSGWVPRAVPHPGLIPNPSQVPSPPRPHIRRHEVPRDRPGPDVATPPKSGKGEDKREKQEEQKSAGKKPTIEAKAYTQHTTDTARTTKWIEVPIHELVQYCRYEIENEKVNPKDYSQVLITRQQGRSPTTPGTTFLAGPIKLRDG